LGVGCCNQHQAISINQIATPDNRHPTTDNRQTTTNNQLDKSLLEIDVKGVSFLLAGEKESIAGRDGWREKSDGLKNLTEF
jgi:hypothetical protein